MRQGVMRLLRFVNGWDLFVTTGLIIVALYGLLADPLQPYPWWTSALVTIVWLWYLIFGRKSDDQHADQRGLVFSVGGIVMANVAVCVNPFLSTLPYVLVFYIWWITLPNRRRAIALTVTLFVTTTVTHVVADYARDGFIHSDPMIIGLWLPLVNLVGLVAICLWLDRLYQRGQERLRLMRELREASAKEALLQQETVALSERTRLAQDVHDTIAQDLAGLRFLVAQARRLATPLVAGAPLDEADAEALDRAFDMVASAVEVALTETRGLIATTMPVQLDSSLADAVTQIAARFSRETGISATVDVKVARLPREAEVVLVRCLQEGLSNVRKHAQASAVNATISLEGDAATLALSDNGVGIDVVPTADVGFGLPGLRQRVELLGGGFSISSAGVGQGTTIRVTLPIYPQESHDPHPVETNRLPAMLDEFLLDPQPEVVLS